ncbi:MAG: ArsR/SmtB family transcription factor [Spirochaetota bacterium]
MYGRVSDGSYGHHEDGPDIEQVRQKLPDEESSTRMALLASGFADAGRIRLLGALTEGEVCVGDLALALGVSQSSVSHQLRVLRSIGIVSSSRRGRHIYYAIAWPGAEKVLDQLCAALATNENRQNPASAGDDI